MTPFMIPTNGSRHPKSVVSVTTPLARKTATENSAIRTLRDHVGNFRNCQSDGADAVRAAEVRAEIDRLAPVTPPK
jgi:hypothetical protein